MTILVESASSKSDSPLAFSTAFEALSADIAVRIAPRINTTPVILYAAAIASSASFPAMLRINKEAANAENKYVFNCMNTDKICIFTDNGKMHSIKVADIPLVRFRDKGTPADNLSNYDSAQERMLYVAPLASVKENTLLFVTAASMCKLVSGAEFDVAKRTIVSTKLAEEDSLIFVGSADEMEQVVFQSEGGYFLRFQKQDISAMKKTSIGVRGMKLAEGDKLDHAYLLESRQEYTITYHDKPYVLNRIKLSKRDSKGIKPRI